MPRPRFVLWLNLPQRRASRALLDQAFERGICVAWDNVFSVRAHHGNCLRIRCGRGWDARIERGLTALGEPGRAMLRR